MANGSEADDITIDSGTIYFISDAHLGASIGPAHREQWLVSLVRGIPPDAGGLFVLGDLFDFWFEYRHVVPKGTFKIAGALASLVERNIPIVYLGGNHDFWVGDFLSREVGVRVWLQPIVARLHGRRVLLAHGDGMGPGDTGYKIVKRVLRNRGAIRAYGLLHPDLGIPLGYAVSALSRRHTGSREVRISRLVRDVAGPALCGDVSGLLMGHVHEPVHIQGSGRDFVINGDWIGTFTHVRMENGQFRLFRRTPNGEDLIPPIPFPDGILRG